MLYPTRTHLEEKGSMNPGDKVFVNGGTYSGQEAVIERVSSTGASYKLNINGKITGYVKGAQLRALGCGSAPRAPHVSAKPPSTPQKARRSVSKPSPSSVMDTPKIASSLSTMKMAELKALAEERGIPTPAGNKSLRQTWIEALSGVTTSTSQATSEKLASTGELTDMKMADLKAMARRRGITEPIGNKSLRQTWVNALSVSPNPGARIEVHKVSSAASKLPGVALCIGSSQDEDNLMGVSPHGLEFRLHRYRSSANGLNPLPGVMRDVVKFKETMSAIGNVEMLPSFVGKVGTNSLTRVSFLNKLERLFNTPGKKLFLLYYSGHGSRNGNLCTDDIDKSGGVSFTDIMNKWKYRKIAARKAQYFVLIADSCHSGALVDQLKKIPKSERDTLNVGIQSASLASEYSVDGFFTRTFAEKQENPNNKFQWVKELKNQCWTCNNYPNDSCQNCARWTRRCRREDLVLYDTVEDIQHPSYFNTWGDRKVPESCGVQFTFFERKKR